MRAPLILAPLLFAAIACTGLAEDWEKFPDNSTGQETEFHGVGGVSIAAYVRKPDGPGPFPTIVLLHGGRNSKGATMALGRSTESPTEDFIQTGWAVYSIDYRPAEKIAIVPIEFDDCVEAVKAARAFPFVNPKRIGLMGGSHGAQITSRLVSRTDASGAVLCAPAALDLIEDKKAAARGEKVVPILLKMAADMEHERGATAEEIEKDPAKYGYSSALTEIAQVRCPILIINGRNDDNSPVSIIDLYVKKLQNAGKQATTYLPDNGPHGFYFGHPDIPESKEAAHQAVAFLQKCFAAAPTPSAATSTATAPAGNPPTETAPTAAVPSTAKPGAQKTRYLYGRGQMDWVDPDHSDDGDLKFKTFHSATIDGEVSYMIWLPPEYDANPDQHFPVLYECPASGGSPRRDTPKIVSRVRRATHDSRIAPMIIVGVPALAGNTMYCDSRDGDYPLETVIVKDLIPHVDATYRTLASRENRAIDGFSMGGFGAAHLGFKFPEVFGVISIMAPPLVEPELQSPLPARAWHSLFTTAMLNDLDYFHANDPFTLAQKNAGALRDRTFIRIVAHEEDEHWLIPQCEKLHQVLLKNSVQHEFCVFSNVKSHNPVRCMDTLGDSAFAFFSSSVMRPP